MDSSFEGKVALVTGAGTGIGAAAARLLARRGAAVTVVGRRKEPLEEIARSIREAGGRALVVAADVGVAGDVKDAVEQTVAEFGGLNLAVNNADIAGPSAVPHEMPVDAWDNIVRINLSGPRRHCPPQRRGREVGGRLPVHRRPRPPALTGPVHAAR